MNLCQANHKVHFHIDTITNLGKMTIYDYKKYMGYKGYCTGQDDVSRSLNMYGTWDTEIKNLIESLLYKVDARKSVFIDVGAHIGYFSRLAEKRGCGKIISYEAESESLKLLAINAPSAERHTIWFDVNTEPASFDPELEVEIMKIDIEGNEQHAIRYFSELINTKRVKNIIMEVSPAFNDSYPFILASLQERGYTISELNGTPFNFSFNFSQTNLWLHL